MNLNPPWTSTASSCTQSQAVELPLTSASECHSTGRCSVHLFLEQDKEYYELLDKGKIAKTVFIADELKLEAHESGGYALGVDVIRVDDLKLRSGCSGQELTVSQGMHADPNALGLHCRVACKGGGGGA